MKVVIDSYKLLESIGQNPGVFSAIDVQVNKQAIALLTAQLKHKTLDLARYRDIASAVGAETFELFLDNVEFKMMKAIAKKVDPHSVTTKNGTDDELRVQLCRLATKLIEPTPKTSNAPGKAKKQKKSANKETSVNETEPHAIATKPPGRG